MYNYIKGKITQIYPTYIVIENNNIGYIIKTPNPYSYHLDDNVTISTHVYIREDIIDIYGFKTEEEKELFIKLLSVKGIGPKGALAIIANDDPFRLKQAIKDADAKYLQKFPGIGAKASSQIILDLQGKLSLNQTIVDNPIVENVHEALKSLGYNNSEIKKLDPFINSNLDLPIGELIKQSLKKLF